MIEQKRNLPNGYEYANSNNHNNCVTSDTQIIIVGTIKVLSLKKSDFNKTNKTSTLFTTKESIKPSFCGYRKKSRRGAK